MAKTLKVTVRTLKTGTFEGTVCIPGLRSTKLVRKDGSTLFPTTSALKATARSLGIRLGLNVEYAPTATKKVAKAKKPCCASTCCSQTDTAPVSPVSA